MNRIRLVFAFWLFPSAAWAGGFEFPDNTAEALGRGGAFTAKADNPAALYYNVAGMARLRGTQLQVDTNLVFHSYEFQRAGVYPVSEAGQSSQPLPYEGTPFPKVANSGPAQVGPFLGITTDFGIFDRWTFGIGFFGPSAYGHRTYPETVNGTPNPARYDVLKANLLVALPTLAAAVRVTRWLDLGVALHLVAGVFDLSTTSLVDLGRSLCPNPEYAGCDAKIQLNTTGFSATASLGAMFRPVKPISIGFNFRGPVVLDTTGTVTATSPEVQPITINPEPVTFKARLPYVLRLGIRYAFLGSDGFEHGDVEIDGVYEGWNWAEGDGTKIEIPNLAFFKDINATVTHNYQDTFSARLGGAFNARLPAGVLTVRAGFAFDSAATADRSTRLDFDTMAKYIPTVGLGYRVRGVAVNLAYGYVYMPNRNVTDGVIRSINGTNGGNLSATGEPLPVINNGRYSAQSHIVSMGLTVNWDEALKKTRTLMYAD